MPILENKRGQIVIEIVLGLILVILLIMLVFLFTSPALTGKTTKTSSLTSSASKETRQQYCEIIKIPYQTTQTYIDRDSYYYRDYDTHQYKYSHKNLRYKDWADHDRDLGVFGTTIDRYVVYIENRDGKAGYFVVNFYLRDYNGKITLKSIRKYIRPDEQAKFLYQDYHRDEHRYYDWDYEVISDTKTSYMKYEGYRRGDGYNVYHDSPIIKTIPITKYRTEKICYWK